jgi:hypothetical protein
MNLQLLHTLSGFMIVLSLLSKVIVHYYLDDLHDRAISPGAILFSPFQYLLPYKPDVKNEYLKLKRLCNFFLALAAISLILNIIFGVLIYSTYLKIDNEINK